ncbi:MAG: hypothetical protein HKN92_10130 [Chitinophagales bacterium]|nr:hypothetical protein [Chitinophagales bacterium]
MLTAIRKNETLALSMLVLLTILYRIKLFFPSHSLEFAFDVAEPLSRLFYSVIINSALDLQIILGGASILLTLLHAFWMNQILIKYKLFEKEGFLPSILYVCFMGMSPAFLQCTPVLMALTFMIPVIDKLLEAYNNDSCFKLIFDCGFLVGLASLFYFPSIFMILFVFISLAQLRSVNIKEWLSVIVGLITIYILAFTVFFLFEEDIFKFRPLGSNFSDILKSFFAGSDGSLLGVLGMVIFIVAAVGYTSSQLTGTLIQYRKFITILLFFAIASAISIVVPSNSQSAHLLFLMLPVSIGFINVLSKYSPGYISDLIFFFLLAFTLFLQYFPYFYQS